MDRKLNLSENHLATDMREISRGCLHDLFVVCRKAGVYSVHHPMVDKAMGRPFLSMQKVFDFKKYYSLLLVEGELFVNNIQIRDVGVIDYIKDRMHELELSSILFEDTMTASDLKVFIDRFVKRVAVTSSDYRMFGFLDNRKVRTIHVNSELAQTLFRTGLRYRGAVGENYAVRHMVANYFSGDPQLAVTVLSARYTTTGQQADACGIDYHIGLVKHILPEKFTQLDPSHLIDVAERIMAADPGEDPEAAERMRRLVRACDYHPRRDEILDTIKQKYSDHNLDDRPFSTSLSQVGSLKLEASQTVDHILESIFSADGNSAASADFIDAYTRLLRTRQFGKANSVIETIIERLSSDTLAFRQQAVRLLDMIIKAGFGVNEYTFLDAILKSLTDVFSRKRETFECSEVVSQLMRMLLSLRRYDSVTAFLEVLKTGRRMENGVAVYDSITIKKIFDELNNVELIRRLVNELEHHGNSQIPAVRTILATIQSEEVAIALADIVTHRDRSVRQNSLKVLSELGWPAVTVFSQILRNENNFARPEGRHELPDDKWFLIRNAVFVLGNLGRSEACTAMRLNLNDPDIRVRRELVKALEKIGGDDAADLLMILAEDIDPSIREMAIIALGIFKRPDLVPFFIDLLWKFKGEAFRIITAIALTDAEEGKQYFSHLLQDKARLKSLASGKASITDIRTWIMTAFEKVDRDDADKKGTGSIPKEPISNQSNPLTKTAKFLINKIQPKK